MNFAFLMAEIQILPDSATKAFKEVGKALKPLQAQGVIKGRSAWQSSSNPNKHLSVVEVPLKVPINESVQEIAEAMPESLLNRFVEPINFSAFQISEMRGLRPSEAEFGSILSCSYRMAEPGGASKLFDDYKIVFEELASIAGLRGWAIGQAASFEESFLGLAVWDDLEALKTSLPRSMPYEVEVFRRVRISSLKGS